MNQASCVSQISSEKALSNIWKGTAPSTQSCTESTSNNIIFFPFISYRIPFGHEQTHIMGLNSSSLHQASFHLSHQKQTWELVFTYQIRRWWNTADICPKELLWTQWLWSSTDPHRVNSILAPDKKWLLWEASDCGIPVGWPKGIWKSVVQELEKV